MPSDILSKYVAVFYPELTALYSLAHYGASVYLVYVPLTRTIQFEACQACNNSTALIVECT
jgi:hypothetical protein